MDYRYQPALRATKLGRRGGRMRKLTVRCSFRDPDGALAVTETFAFLETESCPDAEPSWQSREALADSPAGLEPCDDRDRVLDPLTRTDFVRYAGACGDFSEVHHDEVCAAARGLPTVFAMGLVQAGMIGLRATETDGRQLRRLHLVLRERVWPGGSLVLTTRARPEHTELAVRTASGRTVVTGTAEFSD